MNVYEEDEEEVIYVFLKFTSNRENEHEKFKMKKEMALDSEKFISNFAL